MHEQTKKNKKQNEFEISILFIKIKKKSPRSLKHVNRDKFYYFSIKLPSFDYTLSIYFFKTFSKIKYLL
jgi:hypothetical protein